MQGLQYQDSQGRDQARRHGHHPGAPKFSLSPLVRFAGDPNELELLTLDRGCVTPLVIHNWKESSGGDMDMVDGFEDLPSDVQEKVKRAFEQVHVDDEDWNGVRGTLTFCFSLHR